MRLQELATTKVNNLDAMRFFAATAVIFSHAYLVTGHFDSEPLNKIASFINLGSLSVYIFFIISGYLITQSIEKNLNLETFISARALRIFPGLLVCTLFTALVLIPITTNQSILVKAADTEVHIFLLSNILFPGSVQTLGDAFASNPYSLKINSSLWTLSWEILMYGVVFFIGVLKTCIYRKSNSLSLKTIGITTIYLTATLCLLGGFTKSGLQLVMFFALGVCIFYSQKHIFIRHRLMLGAALVTCVFLIFQLPGYKLIFSLALAYAVFYLSYHPNLQLGKFGRYGDFSYGLYIYSFPIQQAIIFNLPGIRPQLLFVLSFLATLPIAVISWKFVEKPALRLKKYSPHQGANNAE